jgi:HEAT repeat protein
MPHRHARLLLLCLLGGLVLWPPAAQGRKKPSLAELAALEWKLEQATNTLVSATDPAARKKALADLSTIDDPRVIKPVATALREDPSAAIRQQAAAVLAKHKTPESKGLLTLASQADPDDAVRRAAKQALGKFPRRMEVAALPQKARRYRPPKGKPSKKMITAALDHPSGDARLWAIKRCRKLGFSGRESLVKKVLLGDPSARVRGRAAQVLTGIAGKRALKALVRATADGDSSVRFHIARQLATFHDPGALLALQKLAQEDAHEDVRAEARDLLEPTTTVGKRLLAQRIKRLGSQNPAERIKALDELATSTHWRTMVPMSCALLSDPSALVRTSAATTLTNMHDASVLTALRVSAMIEPDAKLRNNVRNLLRGLRRRVDGLIKQLGSKNANQRLLAARALGQAAYPPGLDALIRATKDKDPRVRRVVVRGLRNFADERADKALRVASSDGDAEVRRIVDRHFKQRERLKGWRTFFRDTNRLVTKTMDKNPAWRSVAAVGLGVSGAESAMTSLVELLFNDKVEAVRLAAAWSLVLMASDASDKALRKAAAKDKSERVRLAARKYLVIDKVGLDDLIGQLADPSASVRQDAAEALSLRATSKVLHHLIRAAMCDDEPGVRGAALRGLARIGNPLARTVINTAQFRDPDPHVKRVAMMMYILAGGK